MKFQNLNKKLERMDASRKKTPRKSRMGLMLKILLVLIILAAAVYFPVRGIYESGKELRTSARTIAAAAKNENFDQIKSELSNVRKSVNKLNSSLGWLFWVRIIPIIGGYYGDAGHLAKAADFEVQAAQKMTDTLEPFKNELGFSGTPTPNQDRISQMVKVLDKIVPNLDSIEPLLKQASQEVSSIDVNKYPEAFGSFRLRSSIDTAKNFITGAHYAVTQAKPALEVAPSALGVQTPKNYLILFQNDKELRATGGFLTAYASMKIDKGRLSPSASDDIYHIDEQLLKVCQNKICPLTPPDPIVRYLPEANGKPRTAWSVRDSNLSPDLPTALQQFEKMYALIDPKIPWDGIITIDTHVVEELIKITGPVDVAGTTYSAENDKRCNCPNVIYELENYAQVIEKGEADRKAILGTLMQTILQRTLGTGSERLPELINVGVKLAASKNIMVYMHDGKTQQALSQLGWTGQIKETNGDYLHINDSNFAGGKSNMYVTEDVTLEIDTSNANETKHKLTINYKNPQKYNIWLNGINRDYIRIYVPKDAKLVNMKGSDDKLKEIDDELGKRVFQAFIQIYPEKSRLLEVEYTTSNKSTDKEYPLLIQKQGGTNPFEYTIKLNGKQKAKFNLDSDKDLKLEK